MEFDASLLLQEELIGAGPPATCCGAVNESVFCLRVSKVALLEHGFTHRSMVYRALMSFAAVGGNCKDNLISSHS